MLYQDAAGKVMRGRSQSESDQTSLRLAAARMIQCRWRVKQAKRAMADTRRQRDKLVLELYAIKIQRKFRMQQSLRKKKSRNI